MIGPDQIICVNDCGFWVPGDGSHLGIPRESLQALIAHRKTCPGSRPAPTRAERLAAFEAFAKQAQATGEQS